MINELKEVLNSIKSGNNFGEKITLVGATKTVPISEILSAVKFGMPVVAENKVQEFLSKTEKISGAEQHFIGHLQTNKVKYVVGKVSLIQSVDSLRLGQAISNRAKQLNVTQNVLAEINIGGELSKSGFDKENAYDSVKALSWYPNINVCGLMAMLPKNIENDKKIELCLQMRQIYDNLKKDGYNMKFLSIGMSDDYRLAIQNGSNMIRIGRLIFGERK